MARRVSARPIDGVTDGMAVEVLFRRDSYDLMMERSETLDVDMASYLDLAVAVANALPLSVAFAMLQGVPVTLSADFAEFGGGVDA